MKDVTRLGGLRGNLFTVVGLMVGVGILAHDCSFGGDPVINSTCDTEHNFDWEQAHMTLDHQEPTCPLRLPTRPTATPFFGTFRTDFVPNNDILVFFLNEPRNPDAQVGLAGAAWQDLGQGFKADAQGTYLAGVAPDDVSSGQDTAEVFASILTYDPRGGISLPWTHGVLTNVSGPSVAGISESITVFASPQNIEPPEVYEWWVDGVYQGIGSSSYTASFYTLGNHQFRVKVTDAEGDTGEAMHVVYVNTCDGRELKC